jgi:DNA repair protein RadC
MTQIPSHSDRQAQLELRVTKNEALPSPAGIADLMKRWGFSLQPQECVWVIAYDAVLQIRTVVEVARGDHKSANVHLPTLLAAVLVSGCERFYLVHNHTTDVVKPTDADLDITDVVMAAANACGLYFEDHVIVSPSGQWYSFRQKGRMEPAPYPVQNVASEP